MASRIDRDYRRFKQIVRGAIKTHIKKYISRGELIGRKGKDLVSIPLPQLTIPHFKFGKKGYTGVGQGEGEIGQAVAVDPAADGAGEAGDMPGEHILEVEVPLEELAQIMGEELELPRIEPRGKKNISSDKDKYAGVALAGPESLRHFKRTFRQALRRQIMAGDYSFHNPLIVPVKEDKRYRSWKTKMDPESNAVVILMMDVSGSMGDAQKEIVRITSFWIDAWLRFQYKGIDTCYIIHDAEAREVDQETFFHTRESGGTRISSAFEMCLQLIDTRYSPGEWNIYPFHFSDGDNFSDDNERALNLLREKIVPQSNSFSYAQVKGLYGSGAFINTIKEHFNGEEKVLVAEIAGKEEILDAIKVFLGKGL
jgi:sporulation protein YhbH